MLYFHNPGEIDIRGATVAGLSAKEIDSPIGYFGTGLKYSIACILRWGGEITIYSGLTPHKFTSEVIEFRDKSFAQIHHNGASVGFTTEYGKNWEPWQVFRELYANALDEGGDVTPSLSAIAPVAGQTLIEIWCKELQPIYAERDRIILPAMTYDHTSPQVQVKNQPAPSIYYRGVRVADAPCVLTYNFTSGLDLTEDRTVKYSWQLKDKIAQTIQSLSDEEMILSALCANKGMKEAEIVNFPPYYTTSPEFISVAKNLFRTDPRKWEKLEAVIKKHASELLTPKPITLSPLRQKMLDRAISFCERMGYSCDWPVHVANIGDSVLGEYNQATGTIYISPQVFDQGTKQLVSTLYEELTHAHTGKADCNYDMQTHLFNTIVSLYEEHVFGEPI